MNSETKTCDWDGEDYDRNGNERYWHCVEPSVIECCKGNYCYEHILLHCEYHHSVCICPPLPEED